MSRFIDVENYRILFDEEYKKLSELISQGETHLDSLAVGFSEASLILDRIPVADVVLISDVMRLVGSCYDKCDECRNNTANAVEVLVARDIFSDIQSCLIDRHWNGTDIVSFEIDAVKFAELKKKYLRNEFLLT